MKIILKKIGKRFNKEWVFRNVNLEFELNNSYAIIGPNGSGKSTLLQIVAGIISPTEGSITYYSSNKIERENIYRHVALSAPFLELIEEFTLLETLKFHQQFKPFKAGINTQDIIEIFSSGGLWTKHKPVKHFSSGMKQRLKLALAIFSSAPILLLDEPTSNLDKNGRVWYHDELIKNKENKIVIICSNQPAEFEFCENIIDISQYK